ncbi:MAG: hypothetical protein IJ232_11465 [Lachnospiraceae bacterium]|nr:hypothetical protein [Lachnospiraceae bacterium]
MKPFLNKIREPNTDISMKSIILSAIIVILCGFTIGIFQKWLDGRAINELPMILQVLDLTNYFGRLAIWILIASAISIYSERPLLASMNTFLFFISMVASYYIYSHFVLGFLPRSYMLMWIIISFLSVIPAFICWYAKGTGIIAIIISAGILGVLFSQAFLITQGFFVTHLTEVITWIIALFILRRPLKEFALEFGLSLVVAVIYQLFIPYYG